MCGRFAQFTPEKIREVFDIFEKDDEAPDLPFNYNIAPTDPIRVVVSDNNRKILHKIRWGMVTIWSQSKGFLLINVRDDSLRDKETFNDNFEHHRCIIPADGFFEWNREGAQKIPYYFHLKNGELLAFAGLLNILPGQHNKKEPGKDIVSCAIITTKANSLMTLIHDRMPVILPRQAWDKWLDNAHFDKESLLSLLVPYPAEEMEAYPVTMGVNSVKDNKPEYIERVGENLHA